MDLELDRTSSNSVSSLTSCVILGMQINFSELKFLHLLYGAVFQGNRNKSKNKQMGPNQTYKLLYSKGNHKQNKKTTYKMRENICKLCN